MIDQRVKYYNSIFGEPNPRRGGREAHEFEYLLHHYKGKQYQFGAKKGTIGGSTLVMRGKIRKENKEQRAKTPSVNRTRKMVGDFGTQNDWLGINMNKKKRLGDIPQYKLNKEPSVKDRGLLQSKLSATAVKDTKYNEVTIACLNKFHPDDPRDAEDFFENEEK